MSISKSELLNLKIYKVLEVLERKNPSLNAIEKTEIILNKSWLTSMQKVDIILSKVLFNKRITDDKKQIAINLIDKNLKAKELLNALVKCYKCKTKLEKKHFTAFKTICDFCV